MRPYTLEDWEVENTALVVGGDPPPCPWCERTGFYSTRAADPPPGQHEPRRYRGCKFCGGWQDVGGSFAQLIRFECHHADGSVRHDWKYPGESWDCTDCGRRYEPTEAVVWPADDPAHPWRAVPQRRSQAAYRAYWQARGVAAEPFGIL